MPGYDYNLERAKQLMERSNNRSYQNHSDLCSRRSYEQIATVIQANLAQIGITVELVPMEQTALKAAACKDGK